MQYVVGDSMLDKRGYEVGYPYTDKPKEEYYLHRVEEDAIADCGGDGRTGDSRTTVSGIGRFNH